MKNVLCMLLAVGLLVPAPTTKAEAQIIVIPMPKPNATMWVLGEPCERCFYAAGCNCTIMPPIIAS